MFSTIDMATLERMLVGGSLALLAVVVAFGPELKRRLVQLRARGRSATPVLTSGASAIRVASRNS